MNAALQCLSNTPALTNYFLDCPDLVPRDMKPNLGLAYRNLLLELWCNTATGYVEPSSVMHAIKSVFPAFRGFQQHDSQEFLRCMMDQLHKVRKNPKLFGWILTQIRIRVEL
jgi:ubiquitin carboxyl-terminal hydrolase 20/33